MKTIKEYAADAAARLKKSQNGSTPTKNEKSKLPKQPVRAQKPSVRPTGRGK